MRTPAAVKRDLVDAYLSAFTDHYDVRTVGDHARELRRSGTLRRLRLENDEPAAPRPFGAHA
jgi:hypothetical protein